MIAASFSYELASTPEETLLNLLAEAVSVRVRLTLPWCSDCFNKASTRTTGGCRGHSRIGVLFSGGLDSAVVAALADR